MRISVVIPSLDEIDDLPRTIEHLTTLERTPDEIIVVDGGSTDGTLEWLRKAGSVKGIDHVSSARGRGVQMNAGAAKATGDVLLYLHADAVLPVDALERIGRALEEPDVLGGAFTIRFAKRSESPASMPIVAAGINLRTRVSRTATGDQAIFVRRAFFAEIGGFKPWPLFEDVDLVTRLKARGRFVIVRSAVSISDRRYARFGPWRTTLLMWWLRLRYWFGESPETLKRAFVDVRVRENRDS